jgi:hypothetical protein
MKRLVYLGYLATGSTYVSDGGATRTDLSPSDHLELQQVECNWAAPLNSASTARMSCIRLSYRLIGTQIARPDPSG